MTAQTENKQMAIVKTVRWDPDDERVPGLALNVMLREAEGAFLAVAPDEVWEFFNAYGLITSYGLRFADLQGKPVWVNERQPNLLELIGPCVI